MRPRTEPLLRRAAKSIWARAFFPLRSDTGRWDPQLLDAHAATYLRRCAAVQVPLLAASLAGFVPPLVQIPLGVLGMALTWTMMCAVEVIVNRGESVMKALWPPRRRKDD